MKNVLFFIVYIIKLKFILSDAPTKSYKELELEDYVSKLTKINLNNTIAPKKNKKLL
jgi:hypothetical protein